MRLSLLAFCTALALTGCSTNQEGARYSFFHDPTNPDFYVSQRLQDPTVTKSEQPVEPPAYYCGFGRHR